MSLLDKLKSIFGIEKIDLSIFSHNSYSNSQYHVHLDPQFKGTISREGDKLIVNPDRLPPQQKAEFQKLLREDVFSDCDYLLTNTDENMLEMSQSIIDREIKKFSVLENVIPRDDYHALKAALVIKELHAQGKPVMAYRDDVFHTLGERGRKICNLCTAGYFDNILEAYLKVSAVPGFDKEDFLRRYNVMVVASAFSVFVHAYVGKDAVAKAIREKLATNRGYGIHYVNIHALGKQNICTAEQATEMVLAEEVGVEEESRQKAGDSLFIRLVEKQP